MRTLIDLINLSPLVPLKPDVYEIVWIRKNVSYDHFRVFGCRAFVRIPKDERLKLDVKAKPCIFLGYGHCYLAYRLRYCVIMVYRILLWLHIVWMFWVKR